jgi:hypothetical protein
MYQQEASPMAQKLSVLGIDLAKQIFHLVGMDVHGTIVVRKRLYRAQVMTFIASCPRRALAWKPAAVPMTGHVAFGSMGTRSA